MDRQTYDAELRAIAALIADDEVMDCDVEEKVARLFGAITSTADEDTCALVGQVVVDAMRAMRAHDQTTAAASAAE